MKNTQQFVEEIDKTIAQLVYDGTPDDGSLKAQITILSLIISRATMLIARANVELARLLSEPWTPLQ